MKKIREEFEYFVERLYYRDKFDKFIRADLMLGLMFLFFPLWVIYKLLPQNNGRKYP